MYKKLIKIFIWSNVNKFILILFCISLSLTWYLVSDNLVVNIKTIIWNEAKPQLWWDIKISSSAKLDLEQRKFIDELEKNKKIILSEKIQTFSTVFDKGKNSSLVSLNFVDENFPLYWDYEVNKNGKSDIYVTQNVDDLYNINDKIELFWKNYEIWWIIKAIPWNSLNLFWDWKKIVLKLEEFEVLWIDKIWARIDRDYFIKVVNQNEFDGILKDIKESSLFDWNRISDYKKGWNNFASLFEELDKFIKYILIISFLLTILIIFLSVESFYIWNKKSFSILKILWINNNILLSFNIVLFLFILIVSVLISLLSTELIFNFIRSFDITKDFYINYYSLLKAFIVWLIVLSVSIIIPLLKFFSNNPLAWLKENFLQVYNKKEIVIEVLLVSAWSIIIYYLLIWDLLGSVYFTFSLIFIIWILWYLLKSILKYIYSKSNKLREKDYSIFDAVRNTVKPWNLSILISFWFIISFTSLLFISVISLNFLSKLNIDLDNNKNLFVINITDENLVSLTKQEIENSYSVILWRVLSINNESIKDHIWDSKWDSSRFTREFNITDNTLENIKILDWTKLKPGEVSVDYDFSKSLKLKIWDNIEFSIYWKKKSLIVSNIRESNTSSIEPFFYFQFYKEDFENYPKTYFLTTSVDTSNIESYKRDFLERTWNNISFIEVEEILKEVKSISTKVLLLIQLLFSYIFIFCTITLIVSVSFLLPFKKRKTKLYNVLGANNKFLNRNNLFEYFYLQLLSLIISIVFASISTYLILAKTDFINFWIMNYFFSIFILLIIFIILSIIIRIILTRILK